MQFNKFLLTLCVALTFCSQPLHSQEDISADKQFSEWRAKAEKGDAEAQFTVGYFYIVGQGVAKDEIEGVKWYRKAADQNMAEAQFDLGTLYAHGEGVASNDVEAVKWYRTAAEQNYAQAQFNLGVRCVRGEGVAEDDAEGYKWLFLAAAQGHEKSKISVTKLEVALSPKIIADGKQRANAWLKKHSKP